MRIVLGVLFVVIICIAIYYFSKANELQEQCDELKRKQDEEERTYRTKIKSRESIGKVIYWKKLCDIYKITFQEQNFGSLENLQNKIKSILADLDFTNID